MYYIFLCSKRNNKRNTLWKLYQSKKELLRQWSQGSTVLSAAWRLSANGTGKDNERVDGQSGRVPDAEHQSAHLADAAGQRHTCLLANQSQNVLPSRRCEAHRGPCGGQTEGSTVQRKNNINNKLNRITIPTKSNVT